MEKKNCVFIAASLDGFIADKNGGIDWLNSIPNPEGDDMGYVNFTKDMDAIVMGRNTFQTVCSFDIEWPYDKPVFVLSNTLTEIPIEFQEKAQLIRGPLIEIVSQIHQKGFYKLYIDGGTTIQGFLREDLIDSMIITTIPVLLGSGSRLFSDLNKELLFTCSETKLFLNSIVQSHFNRNH